jgi:bacterioferritin
LFHFVGFGFQAHEVIDTGTADLFSKILLMEEGHGDWPEQQRDQIAKIGIQNYLANQTSE